MRTKAIITTLCMAATLGLYAQRTATIETQVEELVEARKVANKIEDEHKKAIAYHDTIAPMFDAIRYQIDKLELIVDDSLWPLPKYRELLFIR